MQQNKRILFGNTWFLPPFRAHGLWVEDATGKNVAEAYDYILAKALVEMLNEKAKEVK